MQGVARGYLEKGIETPMAQGRSTKIISMIEWIRTSRLSIKNSLTHGAAPGSRRQVRQGRGMERRRFTGWARRSKRAHSARQHSKDILSMSVHGAAPGSRRQTKPSSSPWSQTPTAIPRLFSASPPKAIRRLFSAWGRPSRHLKATRLVPPCPRSPQRPKAVRRLFSASGRRPGRG